MTSQDCIEPKNLCLDMIDDYKAAAKQLDVNQDNIKVIRYEDLIHQIWKMPQMLFDFMGLEYQKMTHDLIYQATHPKPAATSLDPKEEASQWLNEMDYMEIANIQRDCKEAMILWGYNFVRSPKELLNFNPVGPLHIGKY